MANLNITIPDGQLNRIRTALAAAASTPSNTVDPATFTAEDARQAVIKWLKDVVRNYETTKGLNAITDAAQAQRDNFAPPADVAVT